MLLCGTMSTTHKNDKYGDIDARSEDDEGVLPPIPAATVVLLRDGEPGLEVLMLKKNSKITFGGMWVFPGGKIDEEDRALATDDDAAACVAAVRETHEETGIAPDFVDVLGYLDGYLTGTGFCITPELGGNFRTAVITTNMPLEIDKPIDFGLAEFCNKCKLTFQPPGRTGCTPGAPSAPRSARAARNRS